MHVAVLNRWRDLKQKSVFIRCSLELTESLKSDVKVWGVAVFILSTRVTWSHKATGPPVFAAFGGTWQVVIWANVGHTFSSKKIIGFEPVPSPMLTSICKIHCLFCCIFSGGRYLPSESSWCSVRGQWASPVLLFFSFYMSTSLWPRSWCSVLGWILVTLCLNSWLKAHGWLLVSAEF